MSGIYVQLLLDLVFSTNIFATLFLKHLSGDKIVDQFENSESLFGRPIHASSLIIGHVFPAVPLNGCVDIIPPPKNASNFALPFISLIIYGHCASDKKVLAAERGGYIAAIIYNNVSNSFFPLKPESDVSVNISSIMIGHNSGELIRKEYCSSDYFVQILSNTHRGFEFYMVPILTCMAMFIVGIVMTYSIRCWNQYRRRRRFCLPAGELHKIPEIAYVKDQTPYEMCVICLEDYQTGDKLRVLPCDHAYHCKCIDPWLLKRRRVCPICKKRIGSRSTNHMLHKRFRQSSATDYDSETYLMEDSDTDTESQNLYITNATTSYGTLTPGRAAVIAGPSNGVHEQTPLLAHFVDSQPAGHYSNQFSTVQVMQHNPSTNACENVISNLPVSTINESNINEINHLQYEQTLNSNFNTNPIA